MAGYDWGRGYGPNRGYGRMRGDYGSDFGSWGNAWGSAPGSGYRGRGPGLFRQWGPPDEARGYDAGWGYDRGVFGGDYPSYGGYPGGQQAGMYYGGRGGYDAGLDRWGGLPGGRGARGYDRGMGYGAGPSGGYGGGSWGAYRPEAGGYGTEYGGGFGGGPFVPEEAYRRHPEMNRPQEHLRGRWPEGGHDVGGGAELDDEEIGQAVSQNLHQDNWIRPDRIQVAVDDGVVTLTGEVQDYMQARYAWDDAWETSGVRGVINNLTVRTDEPHEQHGDPMPQTSGAKKKK